MLSSDRYSSKVTDHLGGLVFLDKLKGGLNVPRRYDRCIMY